MLSYPLLILSCCGWELESIIQVILLYFSSVSSQHQNSLQSPLQMKLNHLIVLECGCYDWLVGWEGSTPGKLYVITASPMQVPILYLAGVAALC